MKIKQRKGIAALGFLLLSAMLAAILLTFYYVFMYEAYDMYGIEQVYNISLELYNQSTFSGTMLTHLGDIKSEYKALNIYPDFITLLILGTYFSYAIMVAIASRKQRNVEFLANLTVVNVYFIFMATFIAGVAKWFYSEVFQKTLINVNYSFFMVNFIVENFVYIFFIMFVILLFINKIEFFGIRKKETMEFDDIVNEINKEEL